MPGTPKDHWTRFPRNCAMSSSRRPADERRNAAAAGDRQPRSHYRLVPRRCRSHPLHHLLGVAAEQNTGGRAPRQSKTAADYYAGGRNFSGFQNGLAVSGDYMSAASFLGISGAIALYGYDGFLYSIGFLVAWLVALLLIAELLRNSGRF